MTYYTGKSAHHEVRDILDNMKTCPHGEVLVTVRLSTLRQIAVLLDKTSPSGQGWDDDRQED
jgi:hypothetical protein